MLAWMLMNSAIYSATQLHGLEDAHGVSGEGGERAQLDEPLKRELPAAHEYHRHRHGGEEEHQRHVHGAHARAFTPLSYISPVRRRKLSVLSRSMTSVLEVLAPVMPS